MYEDIAYTNLILLLDFVHGLHVLFDDLLGLGDGAGEDL